MAAEKLVRLSDVEYYLRRTAKNVLDDAEGKVETLTNYEMGQVGAIAFSLRELADNAHRLPAADAVEVVRCKDCKRRGTAYECPFRQLMHTEAEGYHYVDKTTDDSFCSFGERKGVEA